MDAAPIAPIVPPIYHSLRCHADHGLPGRLASVVSSQPSPWGGGRCLK